MICHSVYMFDVSMHLWILPGYFTRLSTILCLHLSTSCDLVVQSEFVKSHHRAATNFQVYHMTINDTLFDAKSGHCTAKYTVCAPKTHIFCDFSTVIPRCLISTCSESCFVCWRQVEIGTYLQPGISSSRSAYSALSLGAHSGPVKCYGEFN